MRYKEPVSESQSGISRRQFFSYLSLIVACLAAFPLYQAFLTGGPIFYTTNVDEASHLSYWYANYVVEDSGRQRISSRIVRLLHTWGISGGYINLILDIVCTIIIVVSLCRIYRNLQCSQGQARVASLITFLMTTIFSCFNPLLAGLNQLRLETDIVTWLAMPQNSENMFLRSPEPQMSYTILLTALALVSSARMWSIVGIVASPLLYPFVRLPVLFVSLAYLPGLPFRYVSRAFISFAFISFGTILFVRYFVEQSLLQFFIFSHLPVLPLTGVLALCGLLMLRKHLSAGMLQLSGVLVASMWAVENVQIISGWLVTPVNYEQYWGVLVLSGLTALGVLYRSSRPTVWLRVAMVCFFLHAVSLFRANAAVFHDLGNRQEIVHALRVHSPRVACDNLRLAAYLDLAYPMQPPTALSWTRTLNAKNNDSYAEYSCVKRAVEKLEPATMARFNEVFSALEGGYSRKGSDLNVTMGRQSMVQFSLPTQGDDSKCDGTRLILCREPR